MQKNLLVLIDANSLLHRAFHALPPLATPKGELIGAVYGFSSILFKVISELKPQYLAVAWDSAAPTFRHQQYIEYKSHRPETPQDLLSQFDRAKKVLEALNLPQYEVVGYEADDVVGTLAKQANQQQNLEVIVVTSDFDLLQLINEKTKVYTTKRGFSQTMIYDVQGVKNRYQGLSPGQIVDYKALEGDAADNIPGVKGVGEKTAIKLLNKYGDLDQIYCHLSELSDKEKRLLVEGRENAYLSQKLARIVKDVSIQLDLARAQVSDYDHEKILKLFQEYGFRSLLDRLPKSQSSDSQRARKLLLFPEDEELSAVEMVADEEFDFQIAAHLLTGETGGSLDFESLIFSYLGKEVQEAKMSKKQKVFLENQLREKLRQELALEENKEISKIFYEIDMLLKKILRKMQDYGILIDRELLRQKEVDFEEKIKKLQRSIYTDIGHEFNLNSPKQLEVVLFEELKLPVIKRTKTQRSTKETVLKELSSLHPVVSSLLEYREAFKIKSTYLDPLPDLLDKEGRVHTTFNQTKTASGRLSSENPNLQNIPTDPKLGLRKLFIAPPGKKLLIADYSQIELRIMAHITGDQHLIESFERNQDIHSATAARLFDKLIRDVTSKERKLGKTINFALMYGMTAHGLSEQLGIARIKAENYIEGFFKNYPQVRTWQQNFLAECRNKGSVETLFGRRRFLPQLTVSNFHQRAAAERIAINHPLQGTQADLIKIAMIEVIRQIQKKKLADDCWMLLQVHDELVFEVVEKQVEKVAKLVKNEMTNVMDLKVPIEVDFKVGSNWQEAIKL